MKTMKAVLIRSYKNPEDFAPSDVPLAEPAAGDVLVRVQYAGINPSDLGNSQGAFTGHTTLPRVIGRDFAGAVVAGDEALLGKTVMGSGGDVGFTRDGSFAEYLTVPSSGVVEVPAGLDLAQAASLGVPYLAALASIDVFPYDLTGKTLLIIGGAGAVGSASTVIARRRGADVVRTIRGQFEVPDLAESIRNGVFLDVELSTSLEEQASGVTGGAGFDLVINLVGGATFEPSLRCLKPYGRMSCIASPGQPRVEFSLLDFYRKNLTLYGLNTALAGVEESATQLKALFAEFSGQEDKLAALGETQVVPFTDAKNVLTRALAKEYRKPVFKMSG